MPGTNPRVRDLSEDDTEAANDNDRSSPQSAVAPPLAFSEDQLADEFARLHAREVRFVRPWNRWMVWSGPRWEHDDNRSRHVNFARHIARAASHACNESNRKAIATARTTRAVLDLAKADPRIVTSADVWDQDPWLLNTPTGTVDLRTGASRPHNPTDYITKVTAVGPGGLCPLWLDFLDKITAGNRELQAYLQRVAGYALTGSTREQALFFLYGTGANGKSVFISIISGILAEYATTAAMDTFVASRNERHPTELARLRGARLVTAVETENSQRWAVSKIKTMTGGDRITARFMRQDFFEYLPQFKLIIAGNHKPKLQGVDEAIRRRMNLIPFTVTIPPAERDQKLTEKLRAEWPGILQWMIEGCRAWAESGLTPPTVVRDATAEYLADEDTVGRWLAEQCICDASRSTTVAQLFDNWKQWTTREGEPVGTKQAFSTALERDFVRDRTGHGGDRVFRGLYLKPSSG